MVVASRQDFRDAADERYSDWVNAMVKQVLDECDRDDKKVEDKGQAAMSAMTDIAIGVIMNVLETPEDDHQLMGIVALFAGHVGTGLFRMRENNRERLQ